MIAYSSDKVTAAPHAAQMEQQERAEAPSQSSLETEAP